MSKWEELEKAARAATPGPWGHEEIDPTDPEWGACEVFTEGSDNYVATHVCSVKDAAYIAAANPSAILELLAERDALKEQMRDVAMLLLDNDKPGVKQWASGVVLGESNGAWSVRTILSDKQKEIDALKAELDRIRAMEPVFWYRPRSDGCYEGPIHNDGIEAIRKESGAWTPLYTLEKS